MTAFAPPGISQTRADGRYPKSTGLRRLQGVRHSGLIPVADHAHANPAVVMAGFTLGAAVATTPAFGTSETWTLTTISGMPGSGQQLTAIIDGEQIIITAYASTSITVIRGVNGFVTTHLNGAPVYVSTTPNAIGTDGGRVTRRRYQVNVTGGASSIAPSYDNFDVQNLSALYGEITCMNALGVRAMVESFSQPASRGQNAWKSTNSYIAGKVVSYLDGNTYLYTATSNTGTPPPSDVNATFLSDTRHAIGASWDAAHAYVSTNVVFWRGAYWKATGTSTGQEPNISATSWAVIVPTGNIITWVSNIYAQGVVVSNFLPGTTIPALYMSLGQPTSTGIASAAPTSDPIWWGLMSSAPIEFNGQDSTRMATIAPGGSVTAKPLAEDLTQGAYFFLTTWVSPISYANGTTATLGAAGHYPLSGNPLVAGVDSVACTVANTLNPGAPTNYTAWGDYPLNGVVPQPAAVWSSGTTYAAGQVTSSGGVFYRSLQSANLNHAPGTSTPWWDQILSSFEPTAVLGAPTLGDGRVVSIAGRGDSILEGTGDNAYASDGSNGTESGGWFLRGIANKFSCQRIARPGDQLRMQAGMRAQRRRALQSGATHVLFELVVNDMPGFSFEEMQDYMLTEWSRATAQGILVVQTTCTPQTTTTDAWATLANQTPALGHVGDTSASVATSEVQKLNTWLRTVPAPLSATIDVAASVETYSAAANSGAGSWVWKLNSGAASTGDGTHPTVLSHLNISTDATAYGTNWYGYAAWLASLKAPIS